MVLEAVARDLDAIRKKVPGWVQDLGTLYLQARRGKHIDKLTPMLGDILRYPARGEGLHELIARSVDDVPGDGPVTLLGHSLGGIACVDLLATDPPARVDRLITVGSQAGYFHEIGALRSVEAPAGLPEQFPRAWLNIHDPQDMLFYPASVFGPWVELRLGGSHDAAATTSGRGAGW